MDASASIRVKSGYIHILRLYDVAFTVEMATAETNANTMTESKVTRIRLAKAEPKSIAFDVPPLELGLGDLMLPVRDDERSFEVTARIYDFGIVSISLKLMIKEVSWNDFSQVTNSIANLASSHMQWQEALLSVLERVKTALGDALVRPSDSMLEEDYIVAEVNEFAQNYTYAELLDRVNLVPILSGETRELSEEHKKDLLKRRFSYFTDDLVVLTWDRAFLYERQGDTGVLDVLQVANAQLLEFRFYDETLDRELPSMYSRVETAHRSFRPTSRKGYADLARSLYKRVAEVTEMTEKVDNALQVTEDVYFARVYAAALEVFRVKNVAAAVDRKLAIMKDTYMALFDESATSRAEILELSIVLLIIFEIVLAFFDKV